MYKVFIYEKVIYLTSDPNFQAKNCQQLEGADVNKILNLLEGALIEGIILYSENLNLIWKEFQSQFKLIEAAGGLVSNEKGQLLFIFRLGKWDLPKGKLEKGEQIPECAIREVQEECAIQGLELQDQLPNTYHCYPLKGEWVLKTTYWYKMRTNYEGKLVPQTEEGIERVEWLNPDQLDAVYQNTYSSILEVLKAV